MQPTLPNITRADHSNRGKSFEHDLERAHAFYRFKRFGLIEKQPLTWINVSPFQVERAVAGGRITPYMHAKTGNGRCLMAQPSAVDYAGGICGKYVQFDAKETKGKSIPLDNIKQHQVDQLCESENCGNISGFIIHFSDVNRVFFVKASIVRGCFDRMFLKKERKSIPIDFLETEGIEIFRNKENILDWMASLQLNK